MAARGDRLNGRREHRSLRLVLRLDQAGSAAFIVVSLAAAPALGLVAMFPAALRVVGLLFIGYALALAVLGVFMAYGLTRSMSRGDEFPTQWWMSLLRFRPVAAGRPVERRDPGQRGERDRPARGGRHRPCQQRLPVAWRAGEPPGQPGAG
jgi:hypothetical protein